MKARFGIITYPEIQEEDIPEAVTPCGQRGESVVSGTDTDGCNRCGRIYYEVDACQRKHSAIKAKRV